LRTKGIFKPGQQIEKLIGCAQFFSMDSEKPAFYVSADNEEDRLIFAQTLGDAMFVSGSNLVIYFS
jgi:hypothetical protein